MIGDLKGRLEERCGIFKVDQTWFMDGNELANGETINDLGWGNTKLVNLHLDPRAQAMFRGTHPSANAVPAQT